MHHNDQITDRILAGIRSAQFTIADVTGQRAGIYFEAGFAIGRGRPVIWCCERSDLTRVHFDTPNPRHYPSTNEASVIAAIDARKSTDQAGVNDEQRSVARQIEHACAYAARKGWTVADEHVYVDDGISGAEFTNRPGFLRLMNVLKPRARPAPQSPTRRSVSRWR